MGEPGTKAGRALHDAMDHLGLDGLDTEATCELIRNIEAEARSAAEERLPLRDELIDAEHEVAGFLHRLIWGEAVPHTTEPGDGDDCHECYGQAEILREQIALAATEVTPAGSGRGLDHLNAYLDHIDAVRGESSRFPATEAATPAERAVLLYDDADAVERLLARALADQGIYHDIDGRDTNRRLARRLLGYVKVRLERLAALRGSASEARDVPEVVRRLMADPEFREETRQAMRDLDEGRAIPLSEISEARDE